MEHNKENRKEMSKSTNKDITKEMIKSQWHELDVKMPTIVAIIAGMGIMMASESLMSDNFFKTFVADHSVFSVVAAIFLIAAGRKAIDTLFSVFGRRDESSDEGEQKGLMDFFHTHRRRIYTKGNLITYYLLPIILLSVVPCLIAMDMKYNYAILWLLIYFNIVLSVNDFLPIVYLFRNGKENWEMLISENGKTYFRELA